MIQAVLEKSITEKLKEDKKWAVYVIFDDPKDSPGFSMCDFEQRLGLIFSLSQFEVGEIFQKALGSGYPQVMQTYLLKDEAVKKLLDANVEMEISKCGCFINGGGRFYLEKA